VIEPSVPALPESAEEESEGECSREPAKRGQGGKTDARWLQKYEVSGSKAELNDRVREILLELQEELGVSHHPYKRPKRASSEKSSVTDFWHIQHSRKFGATLCCPFRTTTDCPYKIKFSIKNSTLCVLTLSEHDHSKEQRMRGLTLDKAVKVQKAAQEIPTSKSVSILYL
jgi:hypothetical protein